MLHDFSKVFDIDNELWQRVLEIFDKNEKFPKKVTKGRELHHKFPRSFSKKLGEEVDNTEDNLISLTPSDHFRIHYYYYLLANKGFRQPMALAFNLMARLPSKQISPATMEEMAIDYEELRRECISSRIESLKKWRVDNPELDKLRIQHIKESLNTPESIKNRSDHMKGKNAGSSNGMYGKSSPMKGHSCTDWMTEEEVDRWKEAISKSNKGRKLSEESCNHISESKKGNKNPMFRTIQWINNKGHQYVIIPDDVPEEELDEFRNIVHFLWDKHKPTEWRERIKNLIPILEKMEELNTH